MRWVVVAFVVAAIIGVVAGTRPQIDTMASGLQGTGGIAVTPDGTAYVGDSAAGQILKVTPSGRSTVVAHTAGWPQGLALDRQGTLYFTQRGTSALFRLAPSGQVETVADGFRRPLGLAAAPDGGVFVADLDTIWRVEPDGSKALWVAPEYSSFVVGGLAVDSNGTLYFGNPGQHAVEKVEPNRNHVVVNRSEGALDAWAVVVNRDGSLFVGSYGRLLKLYPDGGTREIMTPDRQDLTDLAADRSGNLYASTKSALYRFRAPIPGPPFYDLPPAVAGLVVFVGGALATLILYLQLSGRSGRPLPWKGFSVAGTIMLTSATWKRWRTVLVSWMVLALVVAALIGARAAGMSRVTTVASGLEGIRAMAIAPEGAIYVSEDDTKRILRLSASGQRTVVAHASGGAQALAVGREGSLYFTDREAKALRRLTASGSIETVAAGFNDPSSVAVAPDGSVFVADVDRIWRVGPDGTRSEWLSSADGVFDTGAIAVDATGTLYFVDTHAESVEKLAVNDEPAVLYTAHSYFDGSVLVVNRDGSLFVSGSGRSDLLKVYADGSSRTIAAPGSGVEALATDAVGNVYVSDGSAIYEMHAPIPGPPFYDLDPALAGLLAFIAGAVITLLVYLRSSRRSTPIRPVQTIPAGGL